MKRQILMLSLVLAAAFGLHAQEQQEEATVLGPVNHYWSLGGSSSTKFFFASYPDGGSNIFTLDAALTFCVDTNWRLGGGVGLGGGVSAIQTYLSEDGSQSFGSARNPWVVPAYLRLRYLFLPRQSGAWYANLDVGYMLGLVSDQNSKMFNYYCMFVSPTMGRQFPMIYSDSRVSLGIGINLYWERRQQQDSPHAAAYSPRLGFLANFTFDIAKRKHIKVTVTTSPEQP